MGEQLVADTYWVVSCLDGRTLIPALVGVNKGLEVGDCLFRHGLNVPVDMAYGNAHVQ